MESSDDHNQKTSVTIYLKKVAGDMQVIEKSENSVVQLQENTEARPRQSEKFHALWQNSLDWLWRKRN